MVDLIIKRIVNNPVSSNCFIIYNRENAGCLIVDPGSENPSEINLFLNSKGLVPEYIILTHHHFDHIWAVNYFVERFKCLIIASKTCSLKIKDTKLNLSLYYNDLGFSTYPADVFVEDLNYIFDWNGARIEIYSSTGHSDSCISLLIENNLFSGDALIENVKPVTTLPSGNKECIRKTYIMYKDLLLRKKKITVYPGHGKIFDLNILNLQLKEKNGKV